MSTTKKAASKKTAASKPKKATTKRHKRASKPAPAAKAKAKERASDKSRPETGTVLHRKYKGRDLEVLVLEQGYRFDGQDFSSLSALAKHITGYKTISGPNFFAPAQLKPEAQ